MNKRISKAIICLTLVANFNSDQGVAAEMGAVEPLPQSVTLLDDATYSSYLLAQINSVSQLSDVNPSDWAFTSLQSLVERYGCISGYPAGIFQGQRTLSRQEFAAAVNACWKKINELLADNLASRLTQDDLSVILKLQEEFAVELASLQSRTTKLEQQVNTLESQQFATTTKLFGQVIFGVQGRLNNFADLTPRDGNRDTSDRAVNVTFGSSVQLSLLTGFPDRSILLTGLQAGNISTAIPFTLGNNDFLANSYTRLGYESNTNNNLQLSDLSYRFPVGNRLAVIVGPIGVNPVTVFRGPNRYESAGQGSISAFAQRNPILNLNATNAGIGLDWQFAERFSMQAVYSAANASNTSQGLFGGGDTFGVQIAGEPIDRVDVALYYLRGYSPEGTLNTGVGDQIIGAGAFSTNAYGASFAWRISPEINIGGWLGVTNSSAQNNAGGSVTTLNWIGYANFPDLWGRGNLGGIYLGQPPKITSSNLPAGQNVPGLISGDGGQPGGQSASTTHLEIFYRLRLSNNISLTPGIIFVFSPVGTASSDTITIGTLRTTFSF